MTQPAVSNDRRLIVMLTLLVMLISGWFGIRQALVYLAPVNPADHRLVEVDIPARSNTGQVANILADRGLIRNRTVFALVCRAEGYDAKLQAGYYQFKKSQSLLDIVQEIAAGRVVSRTITIPEGYNLREIGGVLIDKGICTRDEWEKAVLKPYDYRFLRDVPLRENRLEGFLYPDTYRVRKGVTPEQVITMMLNRFQQIWNSDFDKKAAASGFTAYRVVTIASMIEKEALFDEERARIAGVMFNRIRVGMNLQVDATVLYSLGRHKERVLYRDLEVDSPYNTYRNPGLPPGPIACPGYASIKAAISPEKHDYYYYLAMKDGHHFFSRTYQQHLQAKQKYRR